MQNNSGKGRGSESRRPNPSRSTHRARPVCDTLHRVKIPHHYRANMPLFLNTMSLLELPGPLNWGRTRPPLPPCRRPPAPSYLRPFTRSPMTQRHFYHLITFLTSNSQGDSPLLTFHNMRSCLNKSFPGVIWPPGVVYSDSVPPRRTKCAATSESLEN